jgi:hypothetical protein
MRIQEEGKVDRPNRSPADFAVLGPEQSAFSNQLSAKKDGLLIANERYEV